MTNMLKRILIALVLVTGIVCTSNAQYLSNLNVTQNDPIYTTYAAALNRSEYIVNEAYQLVWFDPDKGVNFEVKQAGNWGMIFKSDGKIISKLSQYDQLPVITASYSDLVKFYYYPFKNIRVENFFLVYSSRIAIHDLKITNENTSEIQLDIYPFLQNDQNEFSDISIIIGDVGFILQHKEFPDGWMKEHNIPFQENLKNVFLIDQKADSWGSYNSAEEKKHTGWSALLNDIKSMQLKSEFSDKANIVSLQKKLIIPAGKTIDLRIIRGVVETEKDVNDLVNQCRDLFKEDLNKYVQEDEELYSRIPKLKFENKDYEALYWNAFSLIRQCMLPPEGECSYNYYVFSREPRWGWGYGGQVFHESLTMLAYAFMDPISTMNSQRVFMERQWEDGYINYRTGPYLNETIPENGEYTSSAPWFNWQNWEIYKVTKDKKFLEEAYQSGKKFYEYFVSNRDKDNDGLCEWGANAILECVRDGRVAVWDEVGDPKNFDAVDCNIMLVSEAKALASITKELGLNDEADKWLNDAKKRTDLINKYMWDPETGFYYHIDMKNNTFTFNKPNDLKRKEIIAFLALWAGVANEEQAEELMKHLKNPDEFWRSYGVPTLSADDSYYNPIGYWNGPIWVQWQYLIFRGLLDYGYTEEAKQLVDKVLDNMNYQLKTNHWFWEFYSADDYQAGWNKTYIWAGILARFLIDLNNL